MMIIVLSTCLVVIESILNNFCLFCTFCNLTLIFDPMVENDG